jgi:glycosyltransferase involved in cell wall biosynthesis
LKEHRTLTAGATTVESEPARGSDSGLVAPYSICIVARELAYLFKNGGIGTCNWQLTQLLARAGWRVHILYCRSRVDKNILAGVRRELESSGCSISTLDEFEFSEEAGDHFAFNSHVAVSDKVRHALEALHARYQFDLIEFAELDGAGFRTIQAKRAGLIFGNVPLMVKLHSSSEWLREANRIDLRRPEELIADYLERYSFENADFQIAPCWYMLEYARRIGWTINDWAQVISYAYPEASAIQAITALPNELVFFGRLETRKGFEIFVEAAKELNPQIALTFLGRVTRLSDGELATDMVARNLPGRKVSLLTDLDQSQALEYLRSGNKLAVIPSLVDNLPNTVIECAVNGIPFIASNTGGIPEIVSDAELQSQVLFAPNKDDLRRCIEQYLCLPVSDACRLQHGTRNSIIARNINAGVVLDYERLAQSARQAANEEVGPAKDESFGAPLVTVCVTCNDPEQLPDALAALAAQTYSSLDIVVVPYGASTRAPSPIWDEQSRLYRKIRFLCESKGAVTLADARNRALSYALGEYFVALDACRIAAPDMVASFVGALQRNSAVNAFVCQYSTGGNLWKSRQAARVHSPVGGPFSISSVRNVFGASDAAYRTDILRSVGGFENDFGGTINDWSIFVKLVGNRHRVDVVPKCLFHCRGSGRWRYDTPKQQQVALTQFTKFDDPSKNRAVLSGLVSSLSRTCSLCGSQHAWYLRFACRHLAKEPSDLTYYSHLTSQPGWYWGYAGVLFEKVIQRALPKRPKEKTRLRAPDNQQDDRTPANMMDVIDLDSEILPNNISVSIIVPSFDRPQQLRHALQSLTRQKSNRPIEIIVIDNHPQSRLTPPIVAEFAGVKLISERRQGASYARNSGICASTGEIVVAVDDDTTMPEYWLERLLGPFMHSNVDAVTGNILPLELETESQKLFESSGGLGRGDIPWQADLAWFNSFKFQCAPMWLLGGTANAAFRAAVFRNPSVGLFDEVLGPGTPTGMSEDMYMFYRVIKAEFLPEVVF